ncbi:3-hydroxyacyl-CoA dehydrogenase, partial [Chloroflexota bacterium]
MTKKLEGKVAVVTGAGGGAGGVRGIGKAIAIAMAEAGAKVVVNDIGKNQDGSYTADKVVEEITKDKGVAVANHDGVET